MLNRYPTYNYFHYIHVMGIQIVLKYVLRYSKNDNFDQFLEKYLNSFSEYIFLFFIYLRIYPRPIPTCI